MEYYSYYAANNYLAHHGVLGMKWGQHIFGKEAKLARANKKAIKAAKKARKASEKEAYRTRKENAWIKSNRTEAEARVARYGGREVASRAAKREYSKKLNRVYMKTGAATTLGSIGATTGFAMASGSYAALGTTLALAGMGTVPVAVAVGAYNTYKIGKRLSDQLAFTKDVGTISKDAYSETGAFGKKNK